jgi:hypothetical protein
VARSAFGHATRDGLAADIVDRADLVQALWGVLVVGLGIGIPAGLVYGLYDLWSVPVERSSASSPRTTYREDRRTNNLVSLVAGILVGIAIGLPMGVRSGLAAGLFYGIVAGTGVCLVGRLVLGFASTVEFAEVILGRRLRGVRFMRLLEDARNRQILRQAGSLYQFRHAELQDHLARLYPAQDGAWTGAADKTRREHHREAVQAIAATILRAARRIPRTRWGRALGAITSVALLAAVVVSAIPIVTAIVDPDHSTLTHTRANTLTFSPDGKLLASSGAGQTVLWDLGTRRITQILAGESVGGGGNVLNRKGRPARAGMFTPDGTTLVTAGGGTVHWWETATGRNIGNLLVGTSAEILALSPDWRTVAAFEQGEATLRLWDVATRGSKRLRPWTDSDVEAYSVTVAFSPDGKALTTGGAGGPVRLWEVATGRNIRNLTDDPYWTESRLSPDGKTLATPIHGAGGKGFSINVGGKFQLSDVATGRKTRTLTSGDDKILTSALEFSPDGKTLATAWFDFEDTGSRSRLTNFRVRLWDVATGRNIRTLSVGNAQLLSLAFSPDGKTLATGWDDDRVRLWDVTRRQRQ